jgi:DNA-directed RNA polymerase specialized sigma subunit
MSYDPIQRAIDIQLSGVFNDYRPHNPEDLITRAIDLKYHPQELREESIGYLYLQGYTQYEIGGMKGLSQRHIGRILKKITV